jgi:hypothetical protein
VRGYSDKPSLVKQVFMAIATIVFTSVGLIMLVAGEGADRMWGLITALFFGVGGTVWFVLPRLTRSAREGVHTDVIRFRGSTRPALVFRLSKAKRRIALVGTSAFTVVGILFVLNATALAESGQDNPAWLLLIGLLCIGVFGFLTVLGAASEFSSGASVALIPEGIVSGGAVTSFLPWEAVEEVTMIDVRGTPMVGVVARDPTAVETSALGRILALVGRKTTGVDLAFAGLAAPLGVLADALRRYHHHPEEREHIGGAESVPHVGRVRDAY